MAYSKGLLRYHHADSFLHRADALSKAMWMLILSIGLFFVMPPQFGVVAFALLLFSARVLGKMPFSVLRRSAHVIFFLGALLMVFHSVVQPGAPLVQVGPFTVTDCGLSIGAHYFFTMSSVVIISLIFSFTTDVRDLMAGLVKIGAPYQIAFAVFVMFRFMPVMQNEIETVRQAHAIRGRASRSGLRHRLYLWKRYLFTILINGLRKADQNSIASECRAFGARQQRTELREHAWTRSGLIFFGFWFALLLLFLILQREVDPCTATQVVR